MGYETLASLAGRPEATGLLMCGKPEDNSKLNPEVSLNHLSVRTNGVFLCNE